MRSRALYLVCPALLFARCDTGTAKQSATCKPDTVFITRTDTVVVTPQTLNRDTSYLEYVFAGYALTNIATLDSSIQVDLRYADTANFLKRDMYDGLRNAYLNCETAIKLCNAQQYLKQVDPQLSLVVLDASRPQHIQQLMWDSLDMHPDLKFNYLAPPYETSMHNYGCAVDVTLKNMSTGQLLDMGSDYDFFGKISEPIYEAKFLKSGELSQAAYENRLLLRKIMKKAKFSPINSEWWHFSICTKEQAMARFKLIK